MTGLAIILMVKVAVSTLTLVVPFLALPADMLSTLMGAEVSAPMARLYGVAIAALLVGYGFGLRQHWHGDWPVGVIWMGVVSNGGGALIAASLLDGLPRLMGAGFFGSIALGLIACLLWPGAMGRTE
ncbi:MAG: hypothetical protein AAGM84_10985 [Pseudomonadota bacterium]